jgi:hypothetical protein
MMHLSYQWHDLAGNLGVLLIVGSYFWMQLGRISGQSVTYSLANAAGAALILVSLYFDFNLSAVVIEIFWLAISVMGVFLGLKKPATSTVDPGG